MPVYPTKFCGRTLNLSREGGKVDANAGKVNELNLSEVRMSTLLTEYGERERIPEVGRTSHLVEYRPKPLKQRVDHSHCMHLPIRKRKNERINTHIATNGLVDANLPRHRLLESHRKSDLIR